jgi:hypothetical protein
MPRLPAGQFSPRAATRRGIFMYKLPLVVIYAIVAFNITAFTLADLLLFQSLTIKIIASISTIVSWLLAYLNRNKFLRIG